MADYSLLMNLEKKKKPSTQASSVENSVQQQKSPTDAENRITLPSRKPQEPIFPGTQETVNPSSQELRNPSLQKPFIPGTQVIPKRSTYPKQTFNIHPNIVAMLEDVKLLLKRRFAIKASKEEITEIAIEQLCQDFQKNQETSRLLTRLRKSQEPRKL